MVIDSRSSNFPSRAAALAFAAGLCVAGFASAQPYVDRLLTDNTCCVAPHFDPRLGNAWGLTFDPVGPGWVAANSARRAELLDGLGNPQGLSVQMEVPPLFNGGAVTGLAVSLDNVFLITNSFGEVLPARFLFATLDGTILGWTPRNTPLPQDTIAHIAVNNFARGSEYTGLAVAPTPNGDRIYVPDFFHAKIDVFDDAFAPVALAFSDPTLPAGYAPFNVRFLRGRIFVSYALSDALQDEVVPGAGNGIIDVFGVDGAFQSRLVSHGVLNTPWGMAMAPADFGALSNTLLVANFGDGRINAFNPVTGAFVGALMDRTGAPIAIDGLRGIEFGNGMPNQPTNTLFYSAGPTFAVVGQFGRIDRAADFDGNNTINSGDVTAFLRAWFADLANGTHNSEFDGNATIASGDVTSFLAAWFGALALDG